ncbi:MAG: acyltransferase [Spirochaetes bacterium]|nr:MAG: acyltransferase [Spirochaetota bacterium]
MIDFDDIRPYSDAELKPVLKKIARNRWLASGIRSVFFPRIPNSLKPAADFLINLLIKFHFIGIKTTEEFKTKIALGIAVKYLIKNTTRSISYTGLDYLDPEESYIFVSNHRDIVLDPALMIHVLHKNGFRIPHIAFGSNLMMNDVIADLIRISNGFIVKRDLSMRDQVKESLKLSEYINDLVENNMPIWVAQREGRAKDGIDTTNPAVIKMLYLAKRKEMSLTEFIKYVKIVPVSISYEFDPTDKVKGWALYRKRVYGNHIKRKFEDLVHMTAGMKGYKGNVHFSFAKPLEGDFKTVQEVADAIDNKIQTGYRLWRSNYIAYDTISRTGKYSNRYDKAEAIKFLKRYKKLPEDVKTIVLESYANPVISFENQIKKEV